MQAIFFERDSTDQMALDDFLEDFRRGGVVPDCIRVDNGDGPFFADTKAIGFGAKDDRIALGQAEFNKTSLEEIP